MHGRKQTNISQNFSFKNMILVKVSNYQSSEAQPTNHNKSYEGYKYDIPAYIYIYIYMKLQLYNKKLNCEHADRLRICSVYWWCHVETD